ncbi:MAG: hypothetical protein ABGX83_08110 [Nitrospira sp.]|nr:hypothetical protein [Candidatus Manganitrophaceae bacterium]HIL35317.1 hypothetical protein [Candidatus Manganitrophaceae bacterium]
MEYWSLLFKKRKAGFVLFFTFCTLFCLAYVPGAIADDPGLRFSLRGLEIEIGGEFELEIVDSEADGRILVDKQEPNPFPRMSIDKFVITPRIHLEAGILLKADLEVGTNGKIKLDEAWVKIPGLPFNSWVTIGLDDLFMKPGRKTESYPIVGHAFWQDEDLGLFFGGEGKEFYWRFSITNGRRLKDRRISEDEVFPIVTDDDDNEEKNSNKQVGFGVGIDHAFKEGHTINLLPFYYRSRLSDGDITYLQGITSYPTGDLQNRQERVGLNLDYRLRDFAFFGQYIKGKDGAMDRDGWYVQPSYKYSLGYNRLTAVVFLLRYEDYNVDLTKNPTDSRTWDRQATTVALIASIVKGVKVKTEYYFNDEKTGGPDVDNNELLVQLEIKF